jgi:phenylacetate-coenzyme A ligase PaaK-like adenylate-forming protein
VSNITGLSPIIELVEPGVLPRSLGKAKRVLDMRSGKI